MNTSTAKVAPVRSVIVAVPARNEAARIIRCLDSIVNATEFLGAMIEVCVVVACDNCTDNTVELVDRFATQCPFVHSISGVWGGAGSARRVAVAAGLTIAQEHPTAVTWIATTDADSVVADNWLQRQLHYSDEGYDAVAGVVALYGDSDRTDDLAAGFAATYRFDTPTSHSHVHGANLGVRASAYAQADGFPNIDWSEEHALWNRLAHHRSRRISPTDVVVFTSARLDARAPAGFAANLANLAIYQPHPSKF